MIRILIHGCGGKMGQVLAETAKASTDIEIVAGIDPMAKGQAFAFPVYAAFDACNVRPDVIIDFSVHTALKDLLEGALILNCPLVIATTGHSEEDKALIQTHAQRIPIFQAANMSLGINLMSELIQKAASVLGERFDIEIIEKHHNLKVDAPSGTAYALAEAVNRVFSNAKSFVFGRHTRTERRKSAEIGIHAVRGGTITGEHQVLFAGTDETLEIKHTAHSKQIFAAGALQAARYMAGKSPGFYTMKEMIAGPDAPAPA